MTASKAEIGDGARAVRPWGAIIAVSAGVRGQQLVLAPKDYVRAVSADLAPIQRPAD